jgi:hypothetical protein
MAFTNFYVQTTGNNVNAGSTTDNAASVTVTNGSWDITADTFIGLSGTEFAGVSVGEWASIYNDGATVCVFTGQITAVGALGVSITISTTAKYGTKPAAGATGKSCKVGGAWASELPLAATGLAGTTAPAPTKINIKAGTYTVVASRTIAIGGGTTTPVWYAGYNTTPGDLDNDTTNALAKPLFSLNATFTFSLGGNHSIYSSLNIIGSRSAAIVTTAQNPQVFLRVRVENTSSNAAAIAMTVSTNATLAYCWFKTPTTATTTGTVNSNASMAVVGSVFEGGGLAGWNVQGSSLNFGVDVIVINSGGAGIACTSVNALTLHHLTVYNATTDGVRFTAMPTTRSSLTACLFSVCGGWGINNASGADSNMLFRACNDFFSCTSGQETGFGDSPAFFGQSESVDPLTSSTNMTPKATAEAIGNGFPGIVENQIYSSYQAIGSVQPEQQSGSTALPFRTTIGARRLA